MLTRFVELKAAVKMSLTFIENEKLPSLTAEDWMICAELVNILKAFEEVTSEMSGPYYLTCSFKLS